ncbi:MAG: ArsC/Spx/MgsR family protein [Candidatus Zixiibacteriota bacterium]
MAPKRAQFLTYGNDVLSAETQQFIEDAGVILEVRDIGKQPLSEEELSRLIGHIEITHFLNTMSDSFKKYRLDKHLPSREDIIRLMAKDYTLLRRPIIRSTRLVTVGCDKRKIADMLRLSIDGDKETGRSGGNNSGNRAAFSRQRHASASAGK